MKHGMNKKGQLEILGLTGVAAAVVVILIVASIYIVIVRVGGGGGGILVGGAEVNGAVGITALCRLKDGSTSNCNPATGALAIFTGPGGTAIANVESISFNIQATNTGEVDLDITPTFSGIAPELSWTQIFGTQTKRVAVGDSVSWSGATSLPDVTGSFGFTVVVNGVAVGFPNISVSDSASYSFTLQPDVATTTTIVGCSEEAGLCLVSADCCSGLECVGAGPGPRQRPDLKGLCVPIVVTTTIPANGCAVSCGDQQQCVALGCTCCSGNQVLECKTAFGGVGYPYWLDGTYPKDTCASSAQCVNGACLVTTTLPSAGIEIVINDTPIEGFVEFTITETTFTVTVPNHVVEEFMASDLYDSASQRRTFVTGVGATNGVGRIWKSGGFTFNPLDTSFAAVDFELEADDIINIQCVGCTTANPVTIRFETS